MKDFQLNVFSSLLHGNNKTITDLINRFIAESDFPEILERIKIIKVPNNGSEEFRPIIIVPELCGIKLQNLLTRAN